MARGDLHVHTNVSDGMLTPAAAADAATASELDFFSVADHNTVAGLREAEGALAKDGPRFIYGVELSAQPEKGDELHILGYGFDCDSSVLLAVCRQINLLKAEQIREMVRRLRWDGVEIDVGRVCSDDDAYVGRPTLAEVLVQEGIVGSLNRAFSRYLGRHRPAYVPMREFDPRRCIEGVHSAGGLAVLAHPTIEIVDQWIEALAAMGLDGVEAYRPALTGNDQLYVEKAAEHFGLFVTGGSDWHGREVERPLGAFTLSDGQTAGFFKALAAAEGGQ